MITDMMQEPGQDGLHELHDQVMEQSISWEKMRDDYYMKRS
jgi:hypothetical protein